MGIIIDHREPAKIMQLLNISSTTTTLKTGDYLIGNIAVERKTLSDFLQSFIQKKLFGQLLRMKYEHRICLLIIEGLIDTRMFNVPSVFYTLVQKIVIELEIPVIFSQSIEDTAKILLQLNNKTRKAFFIRGVKIRSANKTKAVQEQILMCFPSVGQKRAKELLLHFGSLNNIFHSSPKEIAQCKGINKKLANRIKQIVEGEKANNDIATNTPATI